MSTLFKYVFVVALGLMLSTAPAVFADNAAADKPARLGRHYGFGPMEILKLQWGLGRPQAADINGDGRTDLVVVNNRKSRIDILLQKADFTGVRNLPLEIIDDDVNDLFGREANWRFKRVGYDLDVAAEHLAMADFNGDGRLDLAFTAGDGLRVALQEAASDKAAPTTGPVEPTWAPATKYDVQGSLAADDINGDGRADLVVLSGEGTFVFAQTDDGLPARPLKIHNASDSAKKVWIADLNGDGRNDLVVLARENYPVRVRFQDAAGQLGPVIRYDLPTPRLMEVVRFPGAPAACILSVAQQSGRLRLSSLGREVSKTEYPVLTYPLPSSEGAGARDTVVADVDGDGLDDVIVSDPTRGEFILFRADAETGLTTPKQFPGLTDMRRLIPGDLDGDGRQAVVVLSVKEKIIGVSRWSGGRLSYPDPVAISGEPVAADLADIDGDGRLDLLYLAHEKADRKYFLRTVMSVGRSDATAGAELHLSELKDKPRRLSAADVDNDGRVDVMILRSYGPLLLVKQDEAGVFAPQTGKVAQAGLVANIDPAGMALAPLGPDGSTALLLAKKNFARAVIFDGETGWKVVDQYQPAHDRSTITTAAAFQIGRDAAPSVVAYDAARRKLGFLVRQANGAYQTDREVEVGSVKARKILRGNFGGGVEAAVLLCGTQKLVLVPAAGRRGVLRKAASFEPTIKDSWFGAAAVGDVNNDGVPDIVLCDQGRKHLEILAFDASASLKPATRFKVFETPRGGGQEESYGASGRRAARQPQAVRVADVTGDGKADVILLVHDRIIVYPQD